jgi:sugar phosphate isomerase/epimerase
MRSFCHILGDEDFEAVEITTNFDPGEISTIADLIHSTRCRLVLAGGSIFLKEGWDLSSPDVDVRQRALARVQEIIGSAASLGADAILIFSGPDVEKELRPAAMDSFKESIVALSDYARKRLGPNAPQIQVEIFDQDLAVRRLLGPSAEAAQLMGSAQGDGAAAGITVDLSHVHQQGEDPEGVSDKLGEFLTHVHLSNCVIDDPQDPLYGDQHPPFGWPGSRVGRAELARFLKALDRAGFFRRSFRQERPIMSLEVKPPPESNPYSVLAEAKADFIAAWSAYRSEDSRPTG